MMGSSWKGRALNNLKGSIVPYSLRIDFFTWLYVHVKDVLGKEVKIFKKNRKGFCIDSESKRIVNIKGILILSSFNYTEKYISVHSYMSMCRHI